ncbi:hypothetical protein Taro_028258 [Colocasia esculenta]|uniref:EF-hand domain-containing protein n=1 Tax=Colocasia esculenta TaxID=4460 RepID=A0A843VG20_COLES|nr:hypothetical protein [Colocasia esculenta]
MRRSADHRAGYSDGRDTDVYRPRPAARPAPAITMEEFLNCLRYADANRDGLISQRELQHALRALGFGVPRWKAWRAMANSDDNGNGTIDNDAELKQLLEYARKNWGLVVE